MKISTPISIWVLSSCPSVYGNGHGKGKPVPPRPQDVPIYEDAIPVPFYPTPSRPAAAPRGAAAPSPAKKDSEEGDYMEAMPVRQRFPSVSDSDSDSDYEEAESIEAIRAMGPGGRYVSPARTSRRKKQQPPTPDKAAKGAAGRAEEPKWPAIGMDLKTLQETQAKLKKVRL